MHTHDTIVLLGPGYPDGQKQVRLDMQKAINKSGRARAILMEDLDVDSGLLLHVKFHKMLDVYGPDLIAAMYMKKGFSNAVDFELGALTCRDSPGLDSLLIMIEEGADENSITKYITGGMQGVSKPTEFTDAKDAVYKILRRIKHGDHFDPSLA